MRVVQPSHRNGAVFAVVPERLQRDSAGIARVYHHALPNIYRSMAPVRTSNHFRLFGYRLEDTDRESGEPFPSNKDDIALFPVGEVWNVGSRPTTRNWPLDRRAAQPLRDYIGMRRENGCQLAAN